MLHPILLIIGFLGLVGGPILWIISLHHRTRDEAVFRLVSAVKLIEVKECLTSTGQKLYYFAGLLFLFGIISTLIHFLIML